jgi:hypothetical protein
MNVNFTFSKPVSLLTFLGTTAAAITHQRSRFPERSEGDIPCNNQYWSVVYKEGALYEGRCPGNVRSLPLRT